MRSSEMRMMKRMAKQVAFRLPADSIGIGASTYCRMPSGRKRAGRIGVLGALCVRDAKARQGRTAIVQALSNHRRFLYLLEQAHLLTFMQAPDRYHLNMAFGSSCFCQPDIRFLRKDIESVPNHVIRRRLFRPPRVEFCEGDGFAARDGSPATSVGFFVAADCGLR